VEAQRSYHTQVEENKIRLLAGMALKNMKHGTRNATLEDLSDPDPARVREELHAIGGLSDDQQAQSDAVELIVSKFVKVVEHEQGCDMLADFARAQIDSCKSRPPDPVNLNWHFTGAAFFMMTVMSTIGYGTFAPSTDLGKWLVVTLGMVSMILFGVCLSVIGSAIDSLVELGAGKLLARIDQCIARWYVARPDATVKEPDGWLIHAKMLVALLVLHSVVALAAAFAYIASPSLNGSQWEYGRCYYFAFVTFSTIGFGDYAIGPTEDSASQLLILLLQALVIFLGLATFNTYASICSDWLKAVALASWHWFRYRVHLPLRAFILTTTTTRSMRISNR